MLGIIVFIVGFVTFIVGRIIYRLQRFGGKQPEKVLGMAIGEYVFLFGAILVLSGFAMMYFG